jgi:flagellin-like protein
MDRSRRADRGLSPVVGTALLIAIVLVFSVVAGYVFFGLSDTSDPAPQTVIEVEHSDDLADWRLVHGGGDRVDGSNLELRGTATPNAASGQNLSVGDEVAFYPTAEEVAVVWYGEDDTSYRLATFEVEQPLPEPDQDCDWVDAESNNGTDEVTVDGIVVNCTVETGDNVYVENGGAVVGAVVSDNKVLDVDDGEVYGDVTVYKVVNVQNGTVTGDVTSEDEEVKLYETTVGGSVDANDSAEVLDDSIVEGDVESRTGVVQIDDSAVEGSVTADGRVDLDDATVEEHVYADPSDFDCTNSTVNGEDCGDYSPRDPDDW